jgi:hypothetical protein
MMSVVESKADFSAERPHFLSLTDLDVGMARIQPKQGGPQHRLDGMPAGRKRRCLRWQTSFTWFRNIRPDRQAGRQISTTINWPLASKTADRPARCQLLNPVPELR